MQVPPEALPDVWAAVLPFVEDALKRSSGEYAAQDVAEAIAAGKWQLWSDGHSICCTSVVEYPRLRVLYVHLGSGELGSVLVMWPALREFARQWGCAKVQFMGRPGWRRSHVMPAEWRHTHDVVTVEV